MIRAAVVAALVFLIASVPSRVDAQQVPCMDFVAAIASLERSHNEVPVWRGRSSKGTMIVLFEAAETRTWTVLIVMPNGRACPADAGGLAERLEKEKKSETRFN